MDKISEIKNIISFHTKKLNQIKENRSRADEENWSESEIKECDSMIRILAEILSDLNKILK